MDGAHGRTPDGLGLTLILLAGATLTSCAPRTPVVALPTPAETLAAAGRRLIRSHSVAEMTALASRGDRVLAALDAPERDALGRGGLRFRVDRPAEVFVAAPRGFAPFWLADQGFASAGFALPGREVFRKAFGPGWVGLGVNGLDRKPPAHYTVFVRPCDGLPVAVSGLDGSNWRASAAPEGVPEILRGATLLRTSDDRRHDTLLAAGQVWKTHVVSGRAPDQVAVSFGADPSAELAWTWRTSPDVRRSVVRVRKGGSGPARMVTGGSEPLAIRELLNDPVVRRHTVRVGGLEPATAYEYAVGDGTPEGTTAWATVRTAPRGGDVSLLYMGDPQCGLEGWGKLLAKARDRRPDATALLIAGDLVDRGNERTNWDHFFLRASGVFERLPLLPCVGNHEYLDRGPWLYRSTFALPANGPAGAAPGLVYGVEIGDAFLAVLDSTPALYDPAQARLQADWLDDRLSRTDRAWKLVMFHHPVYASHPSRESPALRDAWVPVFDRHRVDLVLQGHDHAYLRTYPLRSGRRAGSPPGGTIYVVSVSGDKYYDQDPRDYTEVGFTGVSTYQTIDVSSREGRLTYKSFDASGRERDGFTIDKPSGPRKLAAGSGGPRAADTGGGSKASADPIRPAG